MNPYRHRLAPTPLNLIGLKMDASSVCRYTIATISPIDYNRFKKSPFFAKNQCKIRFVFCPDCSQKPREILNFFQKSSNSLHNILQINNLHPHNSDYSEHSDYSELSLNSLIYKILKTLVEKQTKKNAKTNAIFHSFLHRFCNGFFTL